MGADARIYELETSSYCAVCGTACAKCAVTGGYNFVTGAVNKRMSAVTGGIRKVGAATSAATGAAQDAFKDEIARDAIEEEPPSPTFPRLFPPKDNTGKP